MRIAFVLAMSCLLVTASAAAEWPANRHDAARSATADGPSHLDKPAVTWRYYLGGSLFNGQFLTHDVDGDGKREVLFISSGALVAKTPYNQPVWETPPLELMRLDALVDLNGDGALEVVAAGRGRVHVIDAASGNILWSQPVGNIGVTGAVRLADFDGDAKLDMYVADQGCGFTGSLNDSAEVWSFGTGFDSAVRLFQLERGKRDYYCGTFDTIADLNQDGAPDIVTVGTNFFYVYSGKNGTLLASSENVGSNPYGQALIETANLDADPEPEFVCQSDNNYTSINSRRAFLLDWDASSGKLVKRWEKSAADLVNDRHAYGTGGLVDLENDGTFEIVTSFYSASSGAWTTSALNAATGTERAHFAGGPFRGLVDLDGDESPEIVLGDHTSSITVLRFAANALSVVFEQPHFELLQTRVRDATNPGANTDGILALDLDQSAPAELLGVSYASDGVTQEALLALSPTANPAIERARLALDANTIVTATNLAASVTRSYTQLLIARSDGILWALDQDLAPTNRGPIGEEITVSGLRFGNYFSGLGTVGRTPLAADLDGDGASEIVVVGSRPSLLRLTTRDATLAREPRLDWSIPGGRLPLLVDADGDGHAEVAHWTNSVDAALRVVTADKASLLWQRTLGSSSLVPASGLDLMSGDVNGDGTPEIVYALASSSGNVLHLNAVQAESGTQRWVPDFQTQVLGAGLGSLFDRDADGALDVLSVSGGAFQWIAGKTGAADPAVTAGGPDYGIVANFDGKPGPEIITSGASFNVTALDLDLTARWHDVSTPHGRINGVLVQCPDQSFSYVASRKADAQLIAYQAATGELRANIALLGGKAYDPPESVPTGIGQLGNATASRNLTGDGKPGVLVPSTDGYLYALDACTLELRWALNLQHPVGEAIFADTDGDGEDEIVVTVSDGYLYGIDRQPFPAPKYVYDNTGDGPATSASRDADGITTRDTLYANWASVAGATAYEYAITAPDGTVITKPDFINVGTATSVTATALTLYDHQKYVFAVRAIGATGTSTATLSDGIVVTLAPASACAGGICPDAGPAGCAACGECTTCENGMCVGTCMSTADGGDAGPADSCNYCGTDTRCVDGRCVGNVAVRGSSGGCCSVAGKRPAHALWLGLSLALLFWARRRRRKS